MGSAALPGYLAAHRACRFFIMLAGVDALRAGGWEESTHFEKYREHLSGLSPADQTKKQRQRDLFFSVMRRQVIKHNKRVFQGSNILPALFSEHPTARVIAHALRGAEEPQPHHLGPFNSEVHRCSIDLRKLWEFCREQLAEELGAIQDLQAFKMHEQDIHSILSGADAWGGAAPEGQRLRATYKLRYAAHPSTQHNNERLVKIASRMAKTGKQEKMANIFFVAANGFIRESTEEEEPGEGAVAEGAPAEGAAAAPRKRKRVSSGPHKLADFESTLSRLELGREGRISSIGLDGWHKEWRRARSSLTAAKGSLLSKRGDKAVEKYLGKAWEEKENALTRKKERCIPLVVDGLLPLKQFCSRKNINSGLVKREFSARGMELAFEANKAKVASLQSELMEDEAKRVDEEIERLLRLQPGGYPAGGGALARGAKLALLRGGAATGEAAAALLEWESLREKCFKAVDGSVVGMFCAQE